LEVEIILPQSYTDIILVIDFVNHLGTKDILVSSYCTSLKQTFNPFLYFYYWVDYQMLIK